MDTDPWMTVEQAAAHLQVHVDTIRRALRAGRIRGYKLSRKSGWRIRASDLERYVTRSKEADDSDGDSLGDLGTG